MLFDKDTTGEEELRVVNRDNDSSFNNNDNKFLMIISDTLQY